MTSAPSSDIFGSYLKKVSKKKSDEVDDETAAESAILKMLSEAAGQNETVSVKDLMDRMDLSPSTFMRTIVQLEDSKLIEMVGVGDKETVAITSLGSRLAG
ncbi:MAG: helix-turn-helix domain-containing protein [Erythrobacter sp.]|nr:helix-turn-helix domain-containing protein [Erythrobacter sp.]